MKFVRDFPYHSVPCSAYFPHAFPGQTDMRGMHFLPTHSIKSTCGSKVTRRSTSSDYHEFAVCLSSVLISTGRG